MELPDPATSLSATSVPVGIQFTVGLSSYLDANTVAQIWEYTSSTPFASATMVAEFRGNTFTLPKSDSTTRYYWAVLKNKSTGYSSAEYPTSAAGVSGVRSTVGTTDITTDAVTGLHASQASAVSITQNSHTPVWIQAATSITFTPAVSCTLRCSMTGVVTFVNPNGSATDMTLGLDSSTAPAWYYKVNVPANTTIKVPFSMTQDISATGGASITISAGGARFLSSETMTIDYIDLSVEEIKR